MRCFMPTGILFGFALWVSASSELCSQTPKPLPVVPKGDNWFDHPEILCLALEQQGVRPGAWQQLAPNSPVYQCEYPPMPARLDSSGQVVMSFAGQQPHPTGLFFQVSGEQPKQVISISIAITIYAAE